jgi:hypothetical protein
MRVPTAETLVNRNIKPQSRSVAGSSVPPRSSHPLSSPAPVDWDPQRRVRRGGVIPLPDRTKR